MYKRKLEPDIRCPLEYGLEIFGGKWNSRIICVLAAKNVLRYSELRREMGNITDAVLAGTLKSLIADGIVSRKSYDEIPPRRCSCATSQIRNDFTPFCLRITAFRQFSQWFLLHSPDAPRRA